MILRERHDESGELNEAMPAYTMIDGVGGIFALSPEQQMPTGVTNYVNASKKATSGGARNPPEKRAPKPRGALRAE